MGRGDRDPGSPHFAAAAQQNEALARTPARDLVELVHGVTAGPFGARRVWLAPASP
jgi:hypothetical protein